MIKRLIVTVMVAAMFSAGAVPAFAEQNPMKVVLEDAVYGGLVGTLLGAATWAFTKHKEDHYNNIAYGAALGVMAGTALGVYDNLNRAMVSYENGKVRLSMPTITPELQENGNGKMLLAFRADLVRGNF